MENEKKEMEIIKINYENEQPTVSGRELHEALGIETPYHKWFPRMCEYGFNETEDFWTKMSESTGGRPSTDHQLTIPMAKELCMLQRNEKGKMFRQYFIKVEEMWNSPEMIMKRALDIANARVEEMKLQNSFLVSTIEQQKPLVDFANQVSNTTDLIDMKTMAKLLKEKNMDIGRNRLFEFLRIKKILMKDNQPYQQYIDAGYFKVNEYTYITPFGQTKTHRQTFVTGKGQLYIFKKVKEFMSMQIGYSDIM